MNLGLTTPYNDYSGETPRITSKSSQMYLVVSCLIIRGDRRCRGNNQCSIYGHALRMGKIVHIQQCCTIRVEDLIAVSEKTF